MSAGGKATTTVEQVFEGRPAHTIGLQPGDRILEIDGAPVTPSKITRAHLRLGRRPLMLLVLRNGERVVLGPVRAEVDEGVYRLGFRLGAEPLGADRVHPGVGARSRRG